MTSRLLRFLVAQVFLCLLLLAIWPKFEIDDSYIFLTYARHLAASGLFAFNPGEITYGFSSPAYVMLLAGASRLTGIPVGIALSNILGILMCGLAAVAVWSIWDEMDEAPSNREMIPAAVLFSGPWFFTVWFIFGMETGLAVLSILGFLLWLVKLRAGLAGYPWLIVGITATSVLATTRLESCIYIACAIVIALVTSRSRSEIRDLAAVAVVSGGTEIAWLLYAKHTFGTYLPWTSTARLVYYLPGNFGLDSAAQFYQLGIVGRSVVALKASTQVVFGGPIRILVVFVPLLAACFFLWVQRKSAHRNWMLQVALLSMVVELLAFAYLFPLFKIRHLAPYIASTWVLVLPRIVGAMSRGKVPVLSTAIVIVVVLWIGGAVQYRRLGMELEPLHRLAASGYLLPTDTLAAEPIGILSFESQARIVDLGGLTDQSVWPLLMQAKHEHISDVVSWEVSKGATKLLLLAPDCGAQGRDFGRYCLVDASLAPTLTLHEKSSSSGD